MPILDLGYRNWEGDRSHRLLRPLVVTATGMRLVWRATWLRRILLCAWLPAIPAGFGFFAYEQSLQSESWRQTIANILENGFERPDVAASFLEDPSLARGQIWAMILLAFFRYPQAIIMVVLFGLAAPKIVSYDLRSRAYLLYFSRPLTVVEYLVGKALVLITLLVLTSTIPALAVYCLGIGFSPDASSIAQTWHLPFRVLIASASLALPTASLAIAYSSFTSESRYASFAWFATWVLGWVTYGTLTSSELMRNGVTIGASHNIKLASPYHALGEIQAAIFGTLAEPSDAIPATILVTVVTIVSMMVAYHRVAGQLRI